MKNLILMFVFLAFCVEVYSQNISTIVSDGEDRVIFKNEDEHTSPIINTYKSENCYIVVTENTIYIISSETQVR